MNQYLITFRDKVNNTYQLFFLGKDMLYVLSSARKSTKDEIIGVKFTREV